MGGWCSGSARSSDKREVFLGSIPRPPIVENFMQYYTNVKDVMTERVESLADKILKAASINPSGEAVIANAIAVVALAINNLAEAYRQKK